MISINEPSNFLFISRLFKLIFFILLFWYACSKIPPIIRANKAKNWIKTPCFIEDSALVSDKSLLGIISATSRHRSEKVPEIIYTYQFNDKTYRSQQYSLQKNYNQELIHKYYAGSTSVCYVNPLDPTEAVLSRELKPHSKRFVIFFVAISAILLLSHIVVLIRTRHNLP
ncbi:DUF3592 domain-containing protein [Lentisphaerota bacterium WC36G]|nr:DUF3592 domain-containing protein [Lentisphaerae bacterium WC36]